MSTLSLLHLQGLHNIERRAVHLVTYAVMRDLLNMQLIVFNSVSVTLTERGSTIGAQ